MRGKEIAALRDKLGWTQKELAAALAEALGKKYDKMSVSNWEREVKDTPDAVAVMLDSIALAQGLPEGALPDHPPLPEDTAPGGGGSSVPPPSAPLGSTPSIYARTCEELWESVAVAIGSVGALTNNQALVIDGRIIDQDKKELGRVWGHLAETNETFRKMLVGLSQGGAGLQVALVTGTTIGKMVQNHSIIRDQLRSANGAGDHPPDADAYAETFPPLT